MSEQAQQPETGARTFRKRPVVVEAYQFHNRIGTDTRPLWIVKAEREGRIHFHPRRDAPGYLTIKTLEGEMRADNGDWIIQGVKGELYSRKPDIFALTYEEVLRTTPAETGGASDLADVLVMTGCRDREDLEDMARVGLSLMESIDQLVKTEGPFHGWAPAEDPTEIVFDLFNALVDAAPSPPAGDAREKLATQLRSGLEAMAHCCSVDMTLWDDFSNTVLRAADALERAVLK